MKKLFLLLLLIGFISKALQAQTFPHPPGSNITHPELTKFVGNWRWVSGSDTLTISLFKQSITYRPPLNYNEESIVGWHNYVKNGVLVESNMIFAGQPYWGGHSSILVSSHNDSPVKLYGSLNDLTKSKRCDLYLTMTNNSNTEMSFIIKDPKGLKSVGYEWGVFTLPVSITLTKQ